MPDVPHQTVAGRIKNVMHRHRQLDRTKARTRMAADQRTRVDDELAHLIGDLLQILDLKLPQIVRAIALVAKSHVIKNHTQTFKFRILSPINASCQEMVASSW